MTAKLHYYRMPEDWTAAQKLDFLRTHTIYTMTPEQQAARAEEACHRLQTPRPHPAVRPARHIRAAAMDYQRANQVDRAMRRANPGHASLPALQKRLAAAQEALFAAVRFQDRYDRRAFLIKHGM